MTAAQIISPSENAPSDPFEDRDLAHLKRLLLIDDRRDIAAIRAELFKLDKRLGTDDRFCRAVADQLVAALKTAEIENHRGLAGVMAPLVVSGIRREIVESRDVMVEALYPITGRLVAAAVGAAMKQLSEDINRKLEASLSPRQVQLRVKALITRRPLSDLVLAETTRGRLERLILIDRASGAVLAATDADGKGEQELDGTLSLLGGLVSAIVQFAGHALADTQGELRQLDFGGQMVLLRASPLFILAAITEAGTPNARLPGAVDAAFLGFLERLQADTSQGEAAALSDLHESVAERSAPTARKPSLSPLKVVGGLLTVLLAYGTWHWWANAHQRHAEELALATIENSPDLSGYPLNLSFDRDTKTIRASGILPTRTEASSLRDQIAKAFPAWVFAPRLAIVSETPLAKATQASLDEQTARAASFEKTLAEAIQTTDVAKSEIQALTAMQSREAARAANLETALTAATKALEELRARTAQNKRGADDRLQAQAAAQATETDGTRQKIDQLAARLDTPLRRLEASVRETAVFFDAGATYRNPENVSRDLGLLAKTLTETPDARLRVVGYGDGSGTAKGNLDAARGRAEHVVADLEKLGVDPHRLHVVTTRSPYPIADEPANGVNRRVVFELAFKAE